MLFDPSGGLKYHLTAWRAGARWETHLKGVQAFVNEWSLKTGPIEHLILIGPSGGYSLPSEFLRALSRVSVIDPDWIARFILRARHPQTNWVPVPAQFKGAHVLFCNVLGQLTDSASTDHPAEERKTRALIKRVTREAKSWASFHDRFWGDCDSQSPAPPESDFQRWDHRPSAEEILSRHQASTTELNEHDAEAWLPSIATRPEYFTWRWDLLPYQTHWIEACYGQVTIGVGK